MPSYGGLLEPRMSKLTALKSAFNAEHFMCRLSWSWSWSAQFTLEMCVTA